MSLLKYMGGENPHRWFRSKTSYSITPNNPNIKIRKATNHLLSCKGLWPWTICMSINSNNDDMQIYHMCINEYYSHINRLGIWNKYIIVSKQDSGRSRNTTHQAAESTYIKLAEYKTQQKHMFKRIQKPHTWHELTFIIVLEHRQSCHVIWAAN